MLEAIAEGPHVADDKPFAPDAAGGRELDEAAKATGVVLGVHQIRRFDADLQTLRRGFDDGCPGRVWRIHSRDRPIP